MNEFKIQFNQEVMDAVSIGWCLDYTLYQVLAVLHKDGNIMVIRLREDGVHTVKIDDIINEMLAKN